MSIFPPVTGLSLPACSVGKSLCVSINSADACTRFTSASVTVRFCAINTPVIANAHITIPTRILFRIAPVIPHAHVHHQRHFQSLHAFHLRFHHSAHRLHLIRRSFKQQFIVHLQQHSSLHAAQFLSDADH